MNKIPSVILLSVISITMLAFASCKDKDEVAPLLLLKGNNPMTILLNSKYVDPGATATDNKDGDISTLIEIEIDIDTVEDPFAQFGDPLNPAILLQGQTMQAGSYIVTYTVSDAAGNITSLEREVKVVNSIKQYGIIYNAQRTDLTPPIAIFDSYEIEVEYDENINNRIWFPKFGNIYVDGQPQNLKVYADIKGLNVNTVDSIIIPLQQFPTKYNYRIQGLQQTSSGYFAGTLDRVNYTFELNYSASSEVSGGTELFKEVYTKKF